MQKKRQAGDTIITSVDHYTVQYTLKEAEYKKLINILSSSENFYNAFLITFLKEVEGDINKVLRILNVGVKSKTKIFNVSLPSYLVTSIKEAIILENYKGHIEADGFISVLELSKTARFKMANIDRQTIIRTFKKYNIEYNYKK